MTRLRTLFSRLLNFLFLAPLQDAFLNLKELSVSMRVLAVGGYLGILAMLGMLVASVLWGAGWGRVTFTEVDVVVQVPQAVVIAGLCGLFLSWAYLLTGASDSNPLIFLPLSLFFCAEMSYLGLFGSLTLAWVCTVLPLVGGGERGASLHPQESLLAQVPAG